jgi:hypothetical protein
MNAPILENVYSHLQNRLREVCKMRRTGGFSVHLYFFTIAVCFFSFSIGKNSSAASVENANVGELHRGETALSNTHVSTRSFRNVAQQEVEQARQLVSESLARFAADSEARYRAPRRRSHPSEHQNAQTSGKTSTIEITPEMRRAAALVAELDAGNSSSDAVMRPDINIKAQSGGGFWLERLEHLGSQPYGPDPGYKVHSISCYGASTNIPMDLPRRPSLRCRWRWSYRTLFAAQIDGRTYALQDDTKAINDAMTDGGRCGKGCYGSSFKNAIVYFPSGRRDPTAIMIGTNMLQGRILLARQLLHITEPR